MSVCKIGLVMFVAGVTMLVTGIIYRILGFVLIGSLCAAAGVCMIELDSQEEKREKIRMQIKAIEKEIEGEKAIVQK